MPERTLILRLNAPFQAWGVGGKGTVKPTQKEPTLSGVLGLIANAQGRARSDSIADLADLTMGTRTDRAGVITRDFYTAGAVEGVAMREETRTSDGGRVFKDVVSKKGVIGVKQYLSGAAFTVALTGDADTISAAVAALRKPARILYLGRRSCPLNRPPVEALVDDNIETVLRTYPLDRALVPEPGKRWRGWHADESLRLVLPAAPGNPAARARMDRPVNFAALTRPYQPRFVRIEHIARADVLPAFQGGAA